MHGNIAFQGLLVKYAKLYQKLIFVPSITKSFVVSVGHFLTSESSKLDINDIIFNSQKRKGKKACLTFHPDLYRDGQSICKAFFLLFYLF
jgi:hypothetical protein